MKRIIWTSITVALLAAITLAAKAQSQTQSLGEYAREARKTKKPPATKVFTNDNLPTGGEISVVGNSPSAPSAAKSDDKESDKVQAAKQPEEMSPEEKQKLAEDLRSHFTDQKKKIADVEHELDLLQREYKLRVAAYYADAGWQLRDPKKWADEDAKYKADVANKEKELQAAKDKLDEVREQARKAGLASLD